MFTLTIQVASLDELESFIASIRHSAPTRLVAEVTQAADTQIPAQINPPAAADEEPKAKRGPGRPKKSAAPENPPAAQPDTPAQASAPAQQTLSLDDARAALQELVTTKGMDVAFGVLKQYGAQRVSELQAADYGAFVDACKAA